MSQREIYAATMSYFQESWDSSAIASMERWLVMESNSKVSASSPWPATKSSRLKNPVLVLVLS